MILYFFQKKKRAEGYKEGDILFNTINVSEFIKTDSPLELLTDFNEVYLRCK
jgi:hypothetical protein